VLSIRPDGTLPGCGTSTVRRIVSPLPDRVASVRAIETECRPSGESSLAAKIRQFGTEA